MVIYKKRIESLDELHQVIEALETLGKEYMIVKRIEWSEPKPPRPKLRKNVWDVEEVGAKAFFTDANTNVKLICKECGTSMKKGCIHCVTHNR
ncbi:hypothetical protein [Bacillus thuringiensis]|uniref:hypothetical protein n=1 Tax=Bacillus thuringiensis TaxID=1428 RepID=UPI0011A5DCAD|nr:hypothetical protein [Bacillus thuringiensis]